MDKRLLYILIPFILWAGGPEALAQDSCRVQISLLTCTPGSELYSIFGHNALRVADSSLGTDIVYNYGTFDFEDPSFYTKFIRGRLRYFVSREAFPDFVYAYQYENRGITEQVIELDCADKREIQNFLENNICEENKYYAYDFLYDNCTTRLRDILEKHGDSTGTVKTAKGMTFRNGIHHYLDMGKMYWSKFGIDLLLGSRIDKKMSNREAMFLPEFLEEAMDGAKAKGSAFVGTKRVILKRNETAAGSKGIFTPLLVFGSLAGLIILLSFSKKANHLLRYFDIIFFFITGILGCLLLFMWFGTDHKQTAGNYNIFWAWPPHLAASFLLYSGRSWIRTYLRAYLAALGLILLLWAFLPQQLNPAIIPIILLLMVRSWKILAYHGDQKATG